MGSNHGRKYVLYYLLSLNDCHKTETEYNFMVFIVPGMQRMATALLDDKYNLHNGLRQSVK